MFGTTSSNSVINLKDVNCSYEWKINMSRTPGPYQNMFSGSSPNFSVIDCAGKTGTCKLTMNQNFSGEYYNICLSVCGTILNISGEISIQDKYKNKQRTESFEKRSFAHDDSIRKCDYIKKDVLMNKESSLLDDEGNLTIILEIKKPCSIPKPDSEASLSGDPYFWLSGRIPGSDVEGLGFESTSYQRHKNYFTYWCSIWRFIKRVRVRAMPWPKVGIAKTL